MSDFNSMSRENKKRQLRRQVITTQQPPPYPVFRDQEEDGDEDGHRHRRRVGLRWRLALFFVAVLAAAAVGRFYYQKKYKYTGYETSWEISIKEGSLVGYQAFGSNVLKYTRDGASYIDSHGEIVWTEGYEMKSPIVSVNGGYAAVADQQGNRIYIYNTDGSQGDVTTVRPISKVAVSGNGIVAAVQEESAVSYINCFASDGRELLETTSFVAGNGYPIDIALSPNGKQLVCSYVYIKGDGVKTRVVFYDFSDVGQNISNRLVGGFDEPFEGTMVPKVVFMKDPYSCAFSGNGPAFFSSKNLASPELIAQPVIEEDIEGVFCSDEYAGVIVRSTAGEFASRLEIFSADGKHVMSKGFSYDYTGAQIDGDLVILYNEDSCRIFNMAGVEKLYATFDFPVSCVRKGRFPDTLLVTGPRQMREIKLQ